MSLTSHYDAARNTCAVLRMEWMSVVRLTGSERISWLQGMITNDAGKLSAGSGCYAAHLNAQGKVVAQMIVLVSEEELLLLVERDVAARLATVFDRLIIMEDAQVADATGEFEVLMVMGPRASTVLESWSGESLPLTALYSHALLERARVVLADLGYVLIVPREAAAEINGELAASGAVAISRDTWEVLRAEAGLPVYGIDIDETTTLPELGQRGISYDKGCYIGQEVVARIKYIGHVNRRFVGFICEGETVPENRYSVQRQGKDVGYVTTGVFSPALGRAIALGFASRAAAEPGTEVILAGKEKEIPARVAPLPFVSTRPAD